MMQVNDTHSCRSITSCYLECVRRLCMKQIHFLSISIKLMIMSQKFFAFTWIISQNFFVKFIDFTEITNERNSGNFNEIFQKIYTTHSIKPGEYFSSPSSKNESSSVPSTQAPSFCLFRFGIKRNGAEKSVLMILFHLKF